MTSFPSLYILKDMDLLELCSTQSIFLCFTMSDTLILYVLYRIHTLNDQSKIIYCYLTICKNSCCSFKYKHNILWAIIFLFLTFKTVNDHKIWLVVSQLQDPKISGSRPTVPMSGMGTLNLLHQEVLYQSHSLSSCISLIGPGFHQEVYKIPTEKCEFLVLAHYTHHFKQDNNIPANTGPATG